MNFPFWSVKMFLLRTALLRRQLHTSSKLLQQFAPRTNAFRSMNQEIEAVEGGEEFGDAQSQPPRFGDAQSQSPRFQRTASASYSRSQPTTDHNKPAINPFPEEVSQNYTSEMYREASIGSFSKEVVEILQAELPADDIEIKPDGALYLPENRYRKILCKAFGPGGWCLVPRGAHSFSNNVLSREYALYCGGRFISQVRGHASVMGFSNPALASEVVRSNALMRACKDLGIGNELWDPSFTNMWKSNYAARRTDSMGKLRWVRKEGGQ